MPSNKNPNGKGARCVICNPSKGWHAWWGKP